jgi:hypothetical protein
MSVFLCVHHSPLQLPRPWEGQTCRPSSPTRRLKGCCIEKARWSDLLRLDKMKDGRFYISFGHEWNEHVTSGFLFRCILSTYSRHETDNELYVQFVKNIRYTNTWWRFPPYISVKSMTTFLVSPLPNRSIITRISARRKKVVYKVQSIFLKSAVAVTRNMENIRSYGKAICVAEHMIIAERTRNTSGAHIT